MRLGETNVRLILRDFSSENIEDKCEVDIEGLRLRRCEGCGLPAAGGAQVLTPS